MRIIITGGSGLLGQYLNLNLSDNNEILSIYNSHPGNCKDFNSIQADITDNSALTEIFKSFRPDVVVHTAAISRPETCDSLPREVVDNVNVIATMQIAKLCHTHKSRLIYTSTDLVYDGNSGQMLDEDSFLNPVSLYAETKLLAESEIKKIFDDYCILRTSLLYGIGLNHSINNFHITLNNFREGKRSRLFYDQFRTPLSLQDTSRLINDLIRLDIKSETINFGGLQRVSRTELAEILCDVGNFDKSLIESISMNDVQNFHKVADVSMNTGKLQALGLQQKSIEESIREIINN